MGIADFLKKVFPPGKDPLLGMDPQCVRYEWLTLRLPTGWRFTQADGRSCKATGPGACSVDFFLSAVSEARKPLLASQFEKKRVELVQTVAKYFLEGKSTGETVLPTGVVWMEAADTQGNDKRLRIALINPKPKNVEWVPPILQVTCTMPASSASAAEQLRAALRGMEWN